MTTYPLAIFGQPTPIESQLLHRWRRKFACPNSSCEQRRREVGARGRRTIGRQTLREYLDPAHGYRVSGYGVERVELGRELIPLPVLPDGTLSFGLPEAVRRQSPTPGVPVPTPLHRHIPVLASVGDPARVGRHALNRAREGGPYWSLALSGKKAALPFVVTCPDCRARCRVDGTLPAEELRRLDEHPA